MARPKTLTETQYGNIRGQLRDFVEKHGVSVVLVASMDVCENLGMLQEAAVIENACGQIGVSFLYQDVQSSSNPNKKYRVNKTPSGVSMCNCQGWIYCTIPNKWAEDRKVCSHTRFAESHPERWQSAITMPTLTMSQIMQPSIPMAAGAPKQTRKIIFADDE